MRPAAEGQILQPPEKRASRRFDPARQLRQIPRRWNETELMSIVGNLLDNAVEATLHCPAPARRDRALYRDDETGDRGGGSRHRHRRELVIRCLNRASPPKR
ncbi:hypothetical protein M8494_01295 [Serratia ureilytica]